MTILTNTPRAGETAEQIAARTAPRADRAHPPGNTGHEAMTDQIRKDIASARRKGFKPGDCYWREATLMVEITPGNFVNESKAKEYGVEPRHDVEHARVGERA